MYRVKAILIGIVLVLNTCPFVVHVNAAWKPIAKPSTVNIEPIRPVVNLEDGELLNLAHALRLATDIIVPAGGSVQTALNTANCGDTVILQAGAAYNANLILNKICSTPITIQSSRVSELPVGVRVTPAQAPLLAKIQSAVNGEPVIKTAAGTKGYRFIGVEITTASASVAVFDLVKWGEDRRTQTTLAQVPSNLSFDRGWIHGWPTQNVQRGVAMNCANCEVINSSITDIHLVGQDAQAVCGWNGTSNVRLINNRAEASGENYLFGGADAAAEAMIPTGIEIRNNHLFKPLSWKVGHPTYAGIHWTIKNLLELKNARNVVIDGNVLENSWGDAQIGFAVLFTVRNQEGTNPWARLENISFTNNIVKDTEQGIQLLGVDNLQPSRQSSGLQIVNNLFTGISHWFLEMKDYDNVTLEHNTSFQGHNILTLSGEPSSGFVYRNNVTIRDPRGFGIFGGGVGEGTAALGKYVPGSSVAGNVIAGVRVGQDGNPFDWARSYPTNNHYPLDLAGLAELRGTDGLVPGYRELVTQPTPSPTPTPVPSPTATPTPLPSPSPSPTATPTPQPSPTPKATPESRIVAWPSSKSARQTLWDQMVRDNWKCVAYDGVLYCRR